MQTICHLDEFKIVYLDEHMVAIHKPAGLLVHRSPIDKHETQFAVQLTRDAIGQKVYPVHRLDKATSGLLLFALSAEVAKSLGEQFSQHSLQKTYMAITRGFAPDEAEIDKPLKYQRDALADKNKKDQPPQDAYTHLRCLKQTTLDYPLGKFATQRYSLLELNPKTGRKHQIRRHLNHISHPIIGDVKYGDRHHNHLFNEVFGLHRLYLAATELQLTHPITQQAITIKASLQTDFQNTLHQLFKAD